MANWGYDECNGPEKWGESFSIGKDGARQSPVAIDTSKVQVIPEFTELKFKYVPDNTKDIENTGSSWKVNINGTGSSLTGGPLKDNHELWQYHAHWGSDNAKGSEHRVDGKMFSAELHLVHWNTKYPSPEVAADKEDGLAVLGMFIEVGEKHEEFQKVVDSLQKIKFKGEKTVLASSVDPTKFLPKSKDFWTYEGSLTTPPLYESVTWIVFREPIQLSEEQITAMRNIAFCCKDVKDGEKKHAMVNNFRPPVPLGSRVIQGNK
uniref:Carbonic anhydrase n=1 Tax=Lepeophtheirus salmonis TaxID=72036 RepID=C1BUN4_LEPSM|nr:Carbonic anhydrase 2 [Lepeophtheirus salmonis]